MERVSGREIDEMLRKTLPVVLTVLRGWFTSDTSVPASLGVRSGCSPASWFLRVFCPSFGMPRSQLAAKKAGLWVWWCCLSWKLRPLPTAPRPSVERPLPLSGKTTNAFHCSPDTDTHTHTL